MLRIEIVDDDCEDGEAHIHKVPAGINKMELMAAIAVFYPTATSVYMVLEEE